MTTPLDLTRHDTRMPVIAGVILTLLVHTALLWCFRSHTLPVARADQDSYRRTIPVWIVLPPVALPRPRPVLPPLTHSRPERAAKHSSSAVASGPHRAAAAPVSRPAAPSVPPPETAANAAPVIDVQAAQQMAGKIDQDNRAHLDTPVAQLQRAPIATPADGNRMGHAIAQTARPDCRNELGGGPLWSALMLAKMALIDKKDHGCRW